MTRSEKSLYQNYIAKMSDHDFLKEYRKVKSFTLIVDSGFMKTMCQKELEKRGL